MKDRAKALAGHLIFSLVALGLPLLGATLYFYPGPLFEADGGREVIRLALAVDLILGPCLTFCVYKKGKKGLRFDLSLIFALQLAAFGYGFHTMMAHRPVAYVYGGQFFHAVSQAQIEGEPSPAHASALRGSGIPYFYVLAPKDLKERERQALAAIESGRPYHVQARLWKAHDELSASSRAEAGFALEDWEKVKTAEGREAARRMAALAEGKPGHLRRLVIVQMRYGNAVALFNAETGILEAFERADVGSLATY